MSDTDLYRSLGVRPIINAAGHLSSLGGSVPTPRVLAVMNEAVQGLVDIPKLQRAVHERMALITQNEAAYITSGASAALYLATAAAVSRHYGTEIEHLDTEQITSSEVLIPSGCRNPYDIAVRQVGARLIEVAGGPDSLSRRIGPTTVALLHAPAGWNTPGTPSVEDAVRVAKTSGLPLIVDAAAQIPPVANLWELTSRGADVALFSGGKNIAGPQSTGLMLGTADFLRWVERLGYPRHGFGRLFKVGREEIIGLLAAVEEAVARDERAQRSWCEAQVETLVEDFATDNDLEVARAFPNIAGQPLPYAIVRPRSGALDPVVLVQKLAESEPSIVVGLIPGSSDYGHGFIINTLALREGEIQTIIEILRRILRTWNEGSVA